MRGTPRARMPGALWAGALLWLLMSEGCVGCAPDSGSPALTQPSLPDAYLSEPYSASLEASGGTAPYSWFLDEGELPLGLTLTTSGVLEGSAEEAGEFAAELILADAKGRIARVELSLTVFHLPSLEESALPDGAADGPYAGSLVVTGGKGPHEVRVIDGELPPGVVLAAEALIGNPGLPGEYAFTLEVEDANGRKGSRAFGVLIYEGLTIVGPPALDDAFLGSSYAATLSAVGGQPPHRWALATGSAPLPPGLSLSQDGVLSGVPNAPGPFAFAVRVTDDEGRFAERVLTLEVLALPPLLEAGFWNIEFFGSPSNGPDVTLQRAGVRDLVLESGAHLWGLAEMVSTAEFNALLSELPGYGGFLADHASVIGGSASYDAGEQKVGMLFRSDAVTVERAEIILTSCDTYFAGRPPLQVRLRASVQGVEAVLYVIVLHAKAYADADAYDRRRSAAICLKSHLDAALPEAQVLVMGDFNDDVDVSIVSTSKHPGCVPAGFYCETPYQGFVADPGEHLFVTGELSEDRQSTTRYADLVDHHLVSNELAARYQPASARIITPPDPELFRETISDHYPVLTRYLLGP